MLTTFDSDENVLEALRLGASGFLLKDSPAGARSSRAIRSVAAGDPILSPGDHPAADGPGHRGRLGVRPGEGDAWLG